MIDREKDGTSYHGAPRCICSSRNQKRIGPGVWWCLSCCKIHEYRVTSEGYLPFKSETAQAMDSMRGK